MKLSTLLPTYITMFSTLMIISTQSWAANTALHRRQEQKVNAVQQLDQDSDSDSDSDSESANHSIAAINIAPEILQGLVTGINNLNKGLVDLNQGVNENKQHISNGMNQVNQNIAALNPDHFFQKITSAAICTIAFIAGLYFSHQDRKIRAPLIATLPKMGLPELLRYYWHYEIFCPRNFLFYIAYKAYGDMSKPATVLAPALAQPPVIQGAPQARRH